MSVASTPGPPASAAGLSPASPMTAAVKRFLESVQAVTTRTGYAETLARLTVVAGPQYPVAARLDKLFTDPAHALRERVLWRLLYDTAARTEEILSLNVEDLDLEFRRARVVSKDGAIEYVHWATATARLLSRLLAGRTAGPVFLADRRAPTSGPRAPARGDICPITGRGRLSYPRVEYLFKTTAAELDPHRQGWTLHQLRPAAR